MRNLALGVTFALLTCAGTIEAADVEFECGPAMFEQPAESDQDIKHRITIEERPNLDSPIYEGLWPMTLEAFQPDGRVLRTTPVALPHFPPSLTPQPIEEYWQHFGPKVAYTGKCDCRSGFLTSVELSFVPNYDSPLFAGLWPITLEMFRAADQERIDEEVPGMVIAANDMQPLRDSLWKATREKFAEMEAVYTFGGIAFTR